MFRSGLRPILLCAGTLLIGGHLAHAVDPGVEIARYNHLVWRTENGLPQNTIRAILQTPDGYIWLASDEGLARFDGTRFTVFDRQNTEAIKSNSIHLLYSDSKGRLWIGSDKGLFCLENGIFTGYSTDDGLSDDNIGSIHEDRQGNLFVGTPGGLNRLRDGQITVFTTEDGLPSNSIGTIYEDRAGNLWVTTFAGVARLNGESISVYTTDDGLPSNRVETIHESRNGDLWFGTPGGLALFKGGEFTVLTAGEGLSNNLVWAIHEDSEGNLWIGTERGLNRLKDGKIATYTLRDGLSHESILSIYEDRNQILWFGTPGGITRFRAGRFEAYSARDGLSSDMVRAIYEDHEGNLWVGTEAGGLNMFKDRKFIPLTASDGLSNDMIWTVQETGDGSIWIGTQGGGLNRLKDGKLTTYTTSDGLVSNIVRALCEDASGDIWIGTPDGLSRFSNGRFTTYRVEDGLSSNAVWALHQDRRGSLWIGTLGGLTELSNGKFTIYTVLDGLSDDAILALHSDSNGDLWIGTRAGGLNRFAQGVFTVYTSRNGLSDDSVRAIYQDGEGVLWVGTRRGGLCRFKDGAFTAYTTREGLFDDCVFQILEDADRNVWMSSPKGVFRVSRSELIDLAEGRIGYLNCASYGTADGMESRECNGGQPGGWRSRDGRLWFPTVRGVAIIDPENMRTNHQPPPVVIEQVVGDQTMFNPASKIELGPGLNTLEFHYTGLSFAAPEKVRFRYKLEGFDPGWVDAGTRRVAFYTSIPPGDYQFRVLASNNDGVWNETGAEVGFYIRPHFYQTYWFLLAVAAGLGLVAWSLYRLRIRQVETRFAGVLEERNRMAREIHDTLAQGFVGIGLQLEAIGRTLKESGEAAGQHLELAQRIVSHSLAEARRTVWNLRARALEFGDLSSALRESAAQITAGTPVQMEFDVTGAPRRLATTIENNLLRVAQEAITNAVKHARPGTVWVDLSFGSDCVRLTIRDDGCGFDAREARSSSEGHFGLIGMRERAERINGQLSVESEPGRGTRVAISVAAA